MKGVFQRGTGTVTFFLVYHLDAVLLTHLDCDHANGLSQIRGAKKFLANHDPDIRPRFSIKTCFAKPQGLRLRTSCPAQSQPKWFLMIGKAAGRESVAYSYKESGIGEDTEYRKKTCLRIFIIGRIIQSVQ